MTGDTRRTSDSRTGYNLTNAETVGKTSVASNMEELQFKSYSDAETKNFMVCSTEGLADPTTLKNVVKSVKQERIKVLLLGTLLSSDYPRRRLKTLNLNVEERVHEIL